MKLLLTLLVAANLFACTAKVDAPAIDWPAPLDDTPVNPTSILDLKITKGTTSNFNKFKLETTSTTYNVYYAYKPEANTTLKWNSEVRSAEGCVATSYESAYEWRELSAAGAVVTTTPVRDGESYNLKKDVSYQLVTKVSKLACTSTTLSFLVQQ